jgi:hypothetical protein
MTNAASSLAPTHLGFPVARRWLGNFCSRGVVILGPILVSRTRR